MKGLLGFLSFVLIVQGAAGVLHGIFGWFDSWAPARLLGFLEGYELYGGIVCVVLGLAAGGAGDALGRGHGKG